ncbi:Hint domain-containing protein [Ruegeria sp. B32]|uniref:Hint domain-containing protein n=1 Tax=Ruegeria sp. B32 TaxID=2867020 RepID=UPI0021A441AD|nr:Hint domain-containing protein [Ruegeria sp. B32]
MQDLRTGDLICTAESGNQSIRWIGRRRFDAVDLRANPKLRPVRICTGALGAGLPTRDLLVSRQHRMMVGSRIAQRMFGQHQVLIPAIKLTALPGIFVDCAIDSIEYFHLLFDRHEILFAESAPTESLYTGPEALKSLGPAARTEILAIFPELADESHESEPARLIPINHQQTRLIARHLKITGLCLLMSELFQDHFLARKDFVAAVLTLPAIPTKRIQPVFGRDFGLCPL